MRKYSIGLARGGCLSFRTPKSDAAVRKAMFAKVGLQGVTVTMQPAISPTALPENFADQRFPMRKNRIYLVDLNFNGKFLRRQSSDY
jgi:hypothetical protein